MASVVITGGSRGIGRAAVERFARRGDRVSFLYEKEHAAAQAVAQATGAAAICADVADREAVEAAFRRIGDVDILICCAGIYHCVNAAMPAFLQKQRGCIITVSSMWGQVGASCEAAYSASKGAVLALSKALAKELGPSGIRVNAVAPGVILTDMCAGLEPEVLESLREETPVGRNGTPEDVAQAMEYLADAEFVTGQVLPVNGGFVI